MIRIDLIEGLLAWFLLRRALRRVVAVNQRVGNVCPRSPKLKCWRENNFLEEEEEKEKEEKEKEKKKTKKNKNKNKKRN